MLCLSVTLWHTHLPLDAYNDHDDDDDDDDCGGVLQKTPAQRRLALLRWRFCRTLLCATLVNRRMQQIPLNYYLQARGRLVVHDSQPRDRPHETIGWLTTVTQTQCKRAVGWGGSTVKSTKLIFNVSAFRTEENRERIVNIPLYTVWYFWAAHEMKRHMVATNKKEGALCQLQMV